MKIILSTILFLIFFLRLGADAIGFEKYKIETESCTFKPSAKFLSIACLPAENMPKFKLQPKESHWDFTDKKFIEFDIENLSETKIAFSLWALSKGGFSGATVENPDVLCTLDIGERKQFKIDLETRFKGKDAIFDSVERSKISSVEIVFNRLKPFTDNEKQIYKNPIEIKIHSIRTSGEPLRALDNEALSKRYRAPEIITTKNPKAGDRFYRTLPEYKSSQVKHVIYLPDNWQKGKKYPVIMEYTGNVYYNQKAFCYSTGYTNQGNLACGLTRGKDIIAINLPFVSKDAKREQFNAWGDPDLTAEYCLLALKDAVENFGADENLVVYTGFSRGEYAANYIALRNDKIANIWKVFVNYNPTIKAERIKAANGSSWNNAADGWDERAKRFKNQPCIIYHPEYIGAHVDMQYLEDNDAALKTIAELRKLLNLK